MKVRYGKDRGNKAKTSINVDRDLWEAFNTANKAKGVTTCATVEGLIKGIVSNPEALKVTVEHVIQKARRTPVVVSVDDAERIPCRLQKCGCQKNSVVKLSRISARYGWLYAFSCVDHIKYLQLKGYS